MSTETTGNFFYRQQMPIQVPFFSPSVYRTEISPCMPLFSDTWMLSICMVPVGMASHPDPPGSVSLLVSLKASAFWHRFAAVL